MAGPSSTPASTTKAGAAGGDDSALKQCLKAIAGIPIEAAISQFGSGLTRQQAEFLRTLTNEDIINLRKTEERMFEALGESGGGCGIYN
jgi:hypothetical protein